MSAEHEKKKAAEEFRKAVEKIHFNAKRTSGAFDGTRKISGSVCYIHDDPTDENYGTIDVQEAGDDDLEYIHRNVYVSAIQKNGEGTVMMPVLGSDVVITQDPSGVEYVIMFSHVDLIRMRSHKEASIGVVETENFVFADGDTSDEKDFEDLEATGKASSSYYDKEKILHSVANGTKTTKITQTSEQVLIEAGDSTVTVNADGSIEIEGKNITVKGTDTTIDATNITLKGSSIRHNDGGQRMVLGDKLVGHLQQLIQQLSVLTVTCSSPGSPSSPPINAVAISSISSQLSVDLSAKSTLD